jgi:tRNA (guanine37-N1)-methyltransferase
MKIHILTLFPEAFQSFFTHSMMKRAMEKKAVSVAVHNLRDYTHDRHKTCDDRPFGGGPGMLMKPEPVFEAVDKLFARKKFGKDTRFIFLSPQGKRFDQATARRFARSKELVFLCGHYEGVDQRVIDKFVTDEISIGDYVLTQGEIPAMVVADAVVRLLPGVLGSENSKEFESFTTNLLEYPQYTRPARYRGLEVPAVLLSGDHQRIAEWRQKQAYQRTFRRRPDLLKQDRSREKKRGTYERVDQGY